VRFVASITNTLVGLLYHNIFPSHRDNTQIQNIISEMLVQLMQILTEGSERNTMKLCNNNKYCYLKCICIQMCDLKHPVWQGTPRTRSHMTISTAHFVQTICDIQHVANNYFHCDLIFQLYSAHKQQDSKENMQMWGQKVTKHREMYNDL
jgi:hypothetical protein